MTRDLERILRATSRTFSLTIRALPAPMREGVAVGYLAARLSDTIADQGSWPRAQRLDCLNRLALAYAEGNEGTAAGTRATLSADLSAAAAGLEHEGERKLLLRSAEVIELVASQAREVCAQLTWVLRHIIEGQRWDLGRFGSSSRVSCLQADEELIRYAWRVAGSVGEFWGRLGVATLGKDFGGDLGDDYRLGLLGGRYGEALQLINILRDLPEDWQRGRCYLPGTWLSPREAWEQGSPQWLARAREGLSFAAPYAASLQSRRLRLATALPAAIGWLTLDLLAAANYQQLEARVKITRPQVRRVLLSGLWACRSGEATEAWLESLAGGKEKS